MEGLRIAGSTVTRAFLLSVYQQRQDRCSESATYGVRATEKLGVFESRIKQGRAQQLLRHHGWRALSVIYSAQNLSGS